MSEFHIISTAAPPPPTVLETITTQDGVATVAANNLNYNGYPQVLASPQIGMTHASADTFTYEDRVWLTPYVVDPSATVGLRGTYQTIQAAITAASSGATVFIRPGTYTENLTLKNGVSLQAFGGHSRDDAPNVTIVGKASLTTDGNSIEMFGIRLQTNGDYCLSNTAGASITLNECFVDCTNNTGLQLGNVSANIFLNNCSTNLKTTGISLYNITIGVLWINNSMIGNDGASTTAGTLSGGAVSIDNSVLTIPMATSSTAQISAYDSVFGITSNVINQTWITTAGSGSSFFGNCYFFSGNQPAISIGVGTTVTAIKPTINSTASNAVSGAGTYITDAPTYISTSATNPTTKTYYEVGDSGFFTPALNFGGASVGLTYANRFANYLRIGNLVYFNINIELSAKGSSTGTAQITGLPFVADAGAGGSSSINVFAISASSLTFTGQVNARLTNGSSTIVLDSFASGGVRAALTNTAFANATFIQISGCYQST